MESNRDHDPKTAIGQPDELTKVAEISLRDFGLGGASLRLLQNFVNAAFVVERDDERWFLKLYNPTRHKQSQVESELLWIETLSTSSDVNAPRPVRTTDDRLTWTAPETICAKPYCVSVSTWINGDTVPNDRRKAAHFAAVGALLGKLHKFYVAWKPHRKLHRPLLTSAGIYGTQGIEGRNVEIALQGLPPEVKHDLGYAEELMKKAELKMGRDSERFGLIHGDPSSGNIRFDSGHATLVDFDDCGYGHFVFDLAVVLAGAWGNGEEYHKNQDALLDGYQRIRPISSEEFSSIPPFMAARAASLLLWAYAQSPHHSWIDGQHQRLREYLGML